MSTSTFPIMLLPEGRADEVWEIFCLSRLIINCTGPQVQQITLHGDPTLWVPTVIQVTFMS